MAQGKKYVDASKKYDKAELHEPAEAFELVKSLANRKFDETVEVAFQLGVDPRKADQMLRGTVSLPAGTGKDVRVAVFATGDAAAGGARRRRRRRRRRRPRRTGCREGFLDFDVAIATPDLMGQVGKLGRVLGPRGLMPNPKTGTVTTDVGQDGRRVQGRQGRVPHRPLRQRARADRQGRASRSRACVRNYGAVLDEIQRAKPPSAKGRYLKGITTSSTMGPGVKINPEVKAAV